MFCDSENVKSFIEIENDGFMNDTSPSYDRFLSRLEKKHGVISEYLRDSNNCMKSLYCQDSFMKDVFNFYPDRLCIDVSHKCNETNTFMYIFLCEDSNGRNEIVAIGFSTNDSSETFIWLLTTFKNHNPNWRKTKILTLDPDIKYKDIARNIFPSPYMIMCFHHALKSFSKTIDIIKIQHMIPNEQIKLAVDLFKSMYNSHSQAEYEMYYQQFMMLHSALVFYFQEVWLPLQHLWRIGLDFFHENVFSSLNCHLEILDNTLKSIFVCEGNLMKFIEKTFVILSIKKNERISLILSNPSMYSRFSTEYQISKVLTPYAAKFVIDQYGLSSEIHMDCSMLSDSYFFDNLGTPINASVSMCQCNFFLYFFLPCRHIFAVRKILNLSAFDETLVDAVWTIKYYQSSLISVQTTLKSINNSVMKESAPKHAFVRNLLEVSLFSLFETSQISDSRMELLNELVSHWKNGKEVCLQFEGLEDVNIPEIRSDCFLDQFSVPSQTCKTETEFDIVSAVSMQSDTPTVSLKKAPIQSKSFNIEYASTYLNGSSDRPFLSSSPIVSEADFREKKWNFRSKILEGSHINYAYLCRIICDSKETIIDWLRQMELICANMLCPTCGCGMTLKLVSRLSDGAVWICSNDMEIKQSCSRRCSVRRGSWFELTNMSFEQILTFCYMWISGFSQSQILSETGISTATYISWNKLNRRVCEEFLMEDADYSSITKMDSSGYAQVLEAWLEKCAVEDPFLKFLQDANAMHRKDSAKHSMG